MWHKKNNLEISKTAHLLCINFFDSFVSSIFIYWLINIKSITFECHAKMHFTRRQDSNWLLVLQIQLVFTSYNSQQRRKHSSFFCLHFKLFLMLSEHIIYAFHILHHLSATWNKLQFTPIVHESEHFAVKPLTIWDLATHKQYPCRQNRPTLIPITRQCYTSAYSYVSEIIFIYLQFTLPHTKPWGCLLNYKGTEDREWAQKFGCIILPHIYSTYIDTYIHKMLYISTQDGSIFITVLHTHFIYRREYRRLWFKRQNLPVGPHTADLRIHRFHFRLLMGQLSRLPLPVVKSDKQIDEVHEIYLV